MKPMIYTKHLAVVLKAIKILLFSSVLCLTSCTKDFEEINTNPENPTTTNPDYLFTYSIVNGTLGNYLNDVYVHQWSIENWMMYMAPKNGMEVGKEYQMPSGAENVWSEIYVNVLGNANQAIILLEKLPNPGNRIAICKIWKAYQFQKLTDIWGSIPFGEALQGYPDRIFAPAYNTQRDIYYSLDSILETASESLNDSLSPGFGDADPVYFGDCKKWQKFANSLRFRLAIRMSNADPAKAEEIISSLQNKPLISANNESFSIVGKSSYVNHLYEVINKREQGSNNWPSKYLLDLLGSNLDPRLYILANPTENSLSTGTPEYRGIPNLLVPSATQWNGYNDDKNISFISEWYIRTEAPVVLMSYAEVCFMQAEAALNGWYSGSPTAYYKTGIRADMEFMNGAIAEFEIADFLPTLAAANLERIITQKYISYALRNGFEAWAEYRRTGFPVLKHFDNTPIDASLLPKRLKYPDSESKLNGIHYIEALQQQGPDLMETPLWWDVE